MQNKTEQNQSKTRLNALCCSADSEGIKALLNSNPEIDINYDQGTPLILAIRSIQVYPPAPKERCLATLRTLVEAGANVHINEEAPLQWAMKIDNHAAVNYFISLGTTFNIDPEDVRDYLDRNPKLDQNLITQLGRSIEERKDVHVTPTVQGM